MKVTTYNGKAIQFPKLNTASERIDFIVDNILEHNEWSKYYNPMSDVALKELNQEDFLDIENRWLGIKVVGKKNKQEHIKSFLDYLAGYILNARDLSQKDNYREFYKLAYCNELTTEEQNRLKELKKIVIYADITKQSFDKSTILIRNIEFEELMKVRIDELKSQHDSLDYSGRFIIEDLEDRMLTCKYIIDEVIDLSNKINQQSNIIKNKVESFKDKFKAIDNRDEVVALARSYTDSKELLRWYKQRIKELIEEYQLITELQLDNGR